MLCIATQRAKQIDDITGVMSGLAIQPHTSMLFGGQSAEPHALKCHVSCNQSIGVDMAKARRYPSAPVEQSTQPQSQASG